MKILKVVLPIVAIVAVISLAGCGNKNTNAKIAEDFTRKALTVPHKEICEVVKSDLETTNNEEYNKKLSKAIESLCGGVVDKSVMKDTTKSFFINIIELHIMASANDFTYKVESVEVTKQNDKQYSYTAKVKASNEDNEITLTGSIQFNDDNKIDHMSINN